MIKIDFTRYTIIKNSDVSKMGSKLSRIKRRSLDIILKQISDWRKREGKADLKCLVIEEDWPEFNLVKRMLENRINRHENESKEACHVFIRMSGEPTKRTFIVMLGERIVSIGDRPYTLGTLYTLVSSGKINYAQYQELREPVRGF